VRGVPDLHSVPSHGPHLPAAMTTANLVEGTAMGRLFGGEAALQYAWINLRARVAKVRSGELERGASAVEWVVISMIVVTIVAAVGYVISQALQTKATSVSNCIAGTTGASGACGAGAPGK
jgi:Flp pilus assembly pilin Flp